jgi:NADPH-dependent 2,4-dienoyl-CoA reductase/sulfur reductase-like enzyme
MRAAGFAGRIILVGEEPDPPYERPPLSKEALTATPEPPLAFFHPRPRYAEHGVELLLRTAVVALDPAARRLELADGRRLDYTRLLLATGGRARSLPVQGDVLTLRTVEDARRIRARLLPGRRVVCIGAGVIGLEVASSAKARGCVVDVIEAGPSVMGRCVSPEIAAWMAELHQASGVALHLDAPVTAVECGRVAFDTGREIAADCVIAGIGMERNVELAAAAGLAVDRGILVDALGRTSDEHVYAAGDVAAFWVPHLGRHMRLESWKHAQDHGIAVGRAMADAGAPYDVTPWFWTDQHGVNLQMAGTAEGAARTVMRGNPEERRFSAWHLDAELRPIGVAAVNAPRDARAGLALIRAGQSLDPAVLADPATPLQRLARH